MKPEDLEYDWQFRVVSEDRTSKGGKAYRDAVKSVYWKLTVTDPVSGTQSVRTGMTDLPPPPDDPGKYLPLQALRGMEKSAQHDRLLGWVEESMPGERARATEAALQRVEQKITHTNRIPSLEEF